MIIILKKWRLFISVLLTTTCYAEINGYVYATLFENKNWDNNEYSINLNLNKQFNNFNVIAQIQSQSEQLRTLYLNYVINTPRFDYNLKIGRINRTSGIYESISPILTSVSILPNSIYTRRLLNANFIGLDGFGACIEFTRQYNHILIAHEIGFNLGQPVISNHSNLQREVFARFISEDLQMHERFNNYNIYAHVTTSNNFIFNFDYNSYKINTIANNDDYLVNYLADNFKQAILNKYTLGAEYSFLQYTITGEYQLSFFNSKNAQFQRSRLNKNKNSYIKFGYHFLDYIQTYYIYSEARSSPIKNYDHAVGITYNDNKYLINLEYHRGKSSGKQWLKYDTALTDDKLRSLILTIAYRFK